MMDLFEPFYDWDVTAIVISLFFVLLLWLFMFKDVFGVGFGDIPVWSRLVTLLLSFPVFYMVSYGMLNK